MSLFEPGGEVGRYKLLGRLATGGMAEIYLARQSGPSGFSKVVVLKVILPHLARDATFMKMFANEAKLAALLNHPSVVQVFDYGEERRGLPYMAMEYIDGRNLTRIAKALRARGERIPRAIALRVISEVCGALDYAHTLTDTAGNPLRIVHRDVSRENILVTYSGRVKLVDFGIAKSTILESYTTEGTIKGKYGYMAPEVIRGEEPDHLVDIYALGVVLYAVLLNRMPFRAKNHAQLLEMILHEEPPTPREVDPTMPEELERIILRAMHKDRAERYERISDLQHSLEGFLVQYESAVHPYHLAQFMASTFPPGTDQDREAYQSLTGATPLTPSGQSRSPAQITGKRELDESDTPAERTPRPAGQRTRVVLGAVAVALFLAAGTLLTWVLLSKEPAPRVTGGAGNVARDARPLHRPDAALAKRALDAAPAAARKPSPDAAHVVEPTPDAAPAVAQQPKPDARPAVTPRPTPAPVRRPGLLWVDAPAPGEVLIGKRRLGSLPLVKRSVPAGTHRLTIRSRSLGYTMQRAVTLAPGGEQRLRFTPGKGTIRVLVHPWAKVTLDGVLRGVTPIKPISVYEGPHVLVLENTDVKQRRRHRVEVKPGKESLVKVIFE